MREDIPALRQFAHNRAQPADGAEITKGVADIEPEENPLLMTAVGEPLRGVIMADIYITINEDGSNSIKDECAQVKATAWKNP